MATSKVVYGVHSIRPDEISATELVCTSPEAAEDYARKLSTDPGVLAGAVTRFVLDTAGQRTAVALYVDGTRQCAPYVSDNRRVYANGHGADRGR